MLPSPYYNMFTERGTAASRVSFRIVVNADKMGEHCPWKFRRLSEKYSSPGRKSSNSRCPSESISSTSDHLAWSESKVGNKFREIPMSRRRLR